MATLTRATALVVFAAGLAAAASALAQSQADFDTCHQTAASKVQGTVSASPSSEAVTRSSPGTSTSSSARVGSGEVSSSTSVFGTTGSSQSAAASASAQDALQNDPSYQQAFRNCLKARGF